MDATLGRMAITKHFDIGARQHQLKFNQVIEKRAIFFADDRPIMRMCANAPSKPSNLFPTPCRTWCRGR